VFLKLRQEVPDHRNQGAFGLKQKLHFHHNSQSMLSAHLNAVFSIQHLNVRDVKFWRNSSMANGLVQHRTR